MQRYRQSEIEELANILKNDGVISVPTDTVYGVCARVNSKEAYNKLMNIKNRPSNKAFPVMCSSYEQIKSIAVVNRDVEKLIKAFMPGPITLVLEKKEDALAYINNSGDRENFSVAVRMAPTEVLRKLIEAVGSPIFMTSANLSGEATCSNLDEIEKTLPILDGMMEGDVSFGEASTIVDCTGEKIKILRVGPIDEKEILDVFES